jgi:nucleoside-diphosphate-sugar epimerase
MRIFLAGASGVIGQRMVPLLIGQGHQVTGLVLDPGDAAVIRRAGGDVVSVDIRDVDALKAAVLHTHPDVVYHHVTDLSENDSAANAELRRVGSPHLMEAAIAAGVRRVVAQSMAWAYEPGDTPATEQTPLDLDATAPRRSIGIKGVVALEEAVRAMPEWVILRFGRLYGPGTWYARGARFARSAQAGELRATPDVESFVHVDDAANAAVQALTWPTGAVNICDDDPAPGTSWVPEFTRAVGVETPPPVSDEHRPWARGASNHHARVDLAWTPEYPTWRTGFPTL